MKQRYLVTGAGGHLGTMVVRRLADRGMAVRALVLPGERVPAGAERIVGDVRSRESLASFFARTDGEALVLVHCAGIVTIASRPDPALWAVNVTGTANMLALARTHAVSRMIYVSSVHAIPETPGVIAERRDVLPEQVTGPYAKAKAAATRLAFEAADAGFAVSVVYPSGITGPGDSRGRNHLVRTVAAMAAGRMPVSVAGGYDFVDVRDVAAGILACAQQGAPGEGYILSGHAVSLAGLQARVCALCGRRPPRWVMPAPAARIGAGLLERLSGRRAVCTPYAIDVLQTNGRFSHQKATAAFGYAPRSLMATLRDTLADKGLL